MSDIKLSETEKLGLMLCSTLRYIKEKGYENDFFANFRSKESGVSCKTIKHWWDQKYKSDALRIRNLYRHPKPAMPMLSVEDVMKMDVSFNDVTAHHITKSEDPLVKVELKFFLNTLRISYKDKLIIACHSENTEFIPILLQNRFPQDVQLPSVIKQSSAILIGWESRKYTPRELAIKLHEYAHHAWWYELGPSLYEKEYGCTRWYGSIDHSKVLSHMIKIIRAHFDPLVSYERIGDEWVSERDGGWADEEYR